MYISQWKFCIVLWAVLTPPHSSTPVIFIGLCLGVYQCKQKIKEKNVAKNKNSINKAPLRFINKFVVWVH